VVANGGVFVSGGISDSGPVSVTNSVPSGVAISARETDTTNTRTFGLQGSTTGTAGFGVHGTSGSSSTTGANISNRGIGAGVWGDSSTLAFGVLGTVDLGVAVEAISNSGADTSTAALDAENDSPTPGALAFRAGNGANDAFCTIDVNGNLTCNGTITANKLVATTAKDFKVDDPLDPANKYLVHASVESSELMNIYSGNALLDQSGQSTVLLPVWFQAENGDFRYQLTSIGAPAPGLYIAEEISGNEFKIAGGKPGGKVSWQVTALRQDAPAKAHPVVVEEEKAAPDRGRYLHPELYGEPQSQRIGYIPPRPLGRGLPAAAPPKLNGRSGAASNR
jgi:hypothetical protein